MGKLKLPSLSSSDKPVVVNTITVYASNDYGDVGTDEYGMFNLLLGNRDVNMSHAKKIAESLKEDNRIIDNPIICFYGKGKYNGQLFVADGQHRLVASRLNGDPVCFHIVENMDMKTIIRMNTNSRNWSIRDYCETQVKLGSEHYGYLLWYVDEYHINLGLSAIICEGKEISLGQAGTLTSALLKSGNFKVKAKSNAERIGKRMNKIRALDELQHCQKIISSREFVIATEKMFIAGADEDTMIARLKNNSGKIVKRADYQQYLFDLQKIYNKGTHQKNQVYAV